MNQSPPVLEYRPAGLVEKLGPLAAWPEVTFAFSIWIPGVTSLLLRGRFRRSAGVALLVIDPVALILFGPVWDAVFSANSAYNEQGLWPFIGTCVAVFFVNLWLGIKDLIHVRDANSVR